MDSAQISDLLQRIAELLEAQKANAFRVRAYRVAADKLRTAPPEVFASMGSLMEAGVGHGIAQVVREVFETGRSRLLDRLEGEVGPEDRLTALPGIGAALAARLHHVLGVETLDDLELAAHDGRLERVPGFGPRRARLVREAILGMPGRAARAHSPVAAPPPVELVLEIDDEYRRLAHDGKLHQIAPRRFNPTGAAWLPILHAERGPYGFTAMYSNTARAHALGRTHDWVVVFYEKDGAEGRATVVTETAGPWRGRRIVRGREGECAVVYRHSEPHAFEVAARAMP